MDATVQGIIEYREALAKLLVEKTARLIQLKKSNLKLEGSESLERGSQSFTV